MQPIALRLEQLLKRKIKFLDDCIGEEVKKEIEKMEKGEVVVLENLRFYKGEEENDPKFAKKLTELGDIFIQDAFAACHRQHASIVGVPKLLPSGIGFLVKKELLHLTRLSTKPKRPLVVIIGGAKVKTKIKFIDKISKIADWILIGHLIRREMRQDPTLTRLVQGRVLNKITEPIDGVSISTRSVLVDIGEGEEQGKDFDIGPKTIELFKEKISQAGTVFWNGPLGKIEEKKFTKGSLSVAKAIIDSNAYSIVGGGDTIAFLGRYNLRVNNTVILSRKRRISKNNEILRRFASQDDSVEQSFNTVNLRDKFDFVSTGGGAMLAFLSGGKLPGIEAIKP